MIKLLTRFHPFSPLNLKMKSEGTLMYLWFTVLVIFRTWSCRTYFSKYFKDNCCIHWNVNHNKVPNWMHKRLQIPYIKNTNPFILLNFLRTNKTNFEQDLQDSNDTIIWINSYSSFTNFRRWSGCNGSQQTTHSRIEWWIIPRIYIFQLCCTILV